MLTPGRLYEVLEEMWVSSDRDAALVHQRALLADKPPFFRPSNSLLPGSVVFFLGYYKARILKVLIGEEIKYVVPGSMYQIDTLLIPLDLTEASPMIKRFADHVRKNIPQENSVTAMLYPFPEPDF